MFQVRQVNAAAVRRFEHSVRRRRLTNVFYFRFEIFLAELFIGKKTCFDAVKRVSGERMIIEIAVLLIERDAIGCDLRWRFLLLVNQLSPVHDQLETFLWLRRRMPIEESPRFPTFEVNNNDRALAGIRDERGARTCVDPNVVEITFRRRDIFAEWDGLYDLIRPQINFHQLRSALDDSLHFGRGGIEHPEIVLIINYDTLYADEMRTGRARPVPLLVGKWFRLAIYNLCDGNRMVIRPEGKIHEDATGFRRNTDSRDLLIRKTGHLFEFCGGDERRSAKKKNKSKTVAHKKDSPLMPKADDHLAKQRVSQNHSL